MTFFIDLFSFSSFRALIFNMRRLRRREVQRREQARREALARHIRASHKPEPTQPLVSTDIEAGAEGNTPPSVLPPLEQIVNERRPSFKINKAPRRNRNIPRSTLVQGLSAEIPLPRVSSSPQFRENQDGGQSSKLGPSSRSMSSMAVNKQKSDFESKKEN